jgi:Cu-processing system ATP-binding protein
MITIQNLSKSFGKLSVLNELSLDLNNQGQITAILGPNGSGKTTLIKSILGMVLPNKGSILFNGKSIKGQWSYRTHIDYLPQIARFPENLTVNELLKMVKDLRGGQPQPRPLIQRFALEPFLNKRLGTLSGGTRQKVNLVQALMYDSPVLILDEPTSGLDPVALLELKRLLDEERQNGKMILITTHIMSFVEQMADEVIFLLEGNVHFRGNQKQLKERYKAANLEHAIAAILQEEPLSFSANGNSEGQAKLLLKGG